MHQRRKCQEGGRTGGVPGRHALHSLFVGQADPGLPQSKQDVPNSDYTTASTAIRSRPTCTQWTRTRPSPSALAQKG